MFRISGSKSSGRGKEEKHNLVIQSLADSSLYGEWEGRTDYEDLANKAKDALEPLSRMRHWTLAHRDADVARGKKAMISPKLKEIRSAVIAAEAALRFAQSKIRNVDYVFDILDSEDDTLQVLETLRVGLKTEEIERERELSEARRGNYHYEPPCGSRPDWLMPRDDPFSGIVNSGE